MNSWVKIIAKNIIPKYIYRFIRMNPRLIFISNSSYLKIKRLNKLAWQQDFDDRGDENSYLLKYSHILDKGLQRRDKKSGHSLEIVKKINYLLKNRSDEVSLNHVEWAETMLKAHNNLQLGNFSYQNGFIFENKHSLNISSFSNHVIERRSIRHYDKVSPTIKEIMPALKLLPWVSSSCNRQTIHVFVTTNQEKVSICVNQNKGATGISGNFLFISVTFDSRSYHLPQETLTGYIDASLAFQNFLLGIHSLGLGATVLNWSHADKSEDKMLRETLEISQNYEIVMNCIVGKPLQGAPKPGKKSIKELVTVK